MRISAEFLLLDPCGCEEEKKRANEGDFLKKSSKKRRSEFQNFANLSNGLKEALCSKWRETMHLKSFAEITALISNAWDVNKQLWSGNGVLKLKKICIKVARLRLLLWCNVERVGEHKWTSHVFSMGWFRLISWFYMMRVNLISRGFMCDIKMIK